MLNAILISVAVVGSLSIIFAILLSYVGKKFEVRAEPLVENLYNVLPHVNCGGCGYPSCMGYAEALAKGGDIEYTLCAPGGQFVADELAKILGRDVVKKIRRVAKLLCRGGVENALDIFDYKGVPTCRAAQLIRGGQKACAYGCLGFGDCLRACRFGAIEMSGGLPRIKHDKCVACEACVKICPKRIITMVPFASEVFVECINRDKGAVTRTVCKVGCIACRRCEKTCPSDAIHVIDNCAVIDYAKCTNCRKCVEACPVKIIAYSG
ncbi:MAG: RnfABCDGE type electron transport complex subunit B [Candidatus Omnitrophica bacterium]|nr:RnfABCDGE type electron transport complex subunit B [Candidatus Omnitrophota bacterium]